MRVSCVGNDILVWHRECFHEILRGSVNESKDIDYSHGLQLVQDHGLTNREEFYGISSWGLLVSTK